MSTLRLSGIIRESIVDGPGIRFAVFAQGCPHRCDGCHNPQTWPFEGGFEAQPEHIVLEMQKNPLLKGVTLSGGEPFWQCPAMAELARAAHDAHYDVITYTGYTFEELLEKAKSEDGVMALLRQTDILIDGRFQKELQSYDLPFRGSANQRVIDVKASLQARAPVTID